MHQCSEKAVMAIMEKKNGVLTWHHTDKGRYSLRVI